MLGIFDSGVGGLSIWREIKKLNKNLPTIYLADQAFFPYGELETPVLKKRVKKAIEFLKFQGCQKILIACNTATVNYPIDKLRKEFPDVNLYGVEPPIEMISKLGKNSLILVTPKTANSAYVLEKLKNVSLEIKVVGMKDLAKAIELNDQKLLDKSLKILDTFQHYKSLTVGLGCTHYSFVKKEIQNKFKLKMKIIDVSESVALHINSNLKSVYIYNDQSDKFITTLKDIIPLQSFINKKFKKKYKITQIKL